MSDKVYDFQEQIMNVGQPGEQLVEAYLRHCFGDVENLSNDRQSQGDGYDFRANGLTWELKTEPRAEDRLNFFFEYVSQDNRGQDGCFVKSKADKWMSLLPGHGMLYIFDLEPLRKWVTHGRRNIGDLPCQNKTYTSFGQVRWIEDTLEWMQDNVQVVNLKDLFDYDYDVATHVITNVKKK